MPKPAVESALDGGPGANSGKRAVQSTGGMPEGQYSRANKAAADRAYEAVPDWDEMHALVEGTKVPGILVTYKEREPDRGEVSGRTLPAATDCLKPVSTSREARNRMLYHADKQTVSADTETVTLIIR